MEYDRAHRQRRKAALAAMVEGTKCPYCRRPMFKSQKLDLSHVIDLAHGGPMDGPTFLAHSRCNRSAGAASGNRLRGARSVSRPRPSKPKRKLPEW